jgi:hypothetical protein
MREHFVRAIADEDLFALHSVMDGERLAQFRRLGIGIKSQCVGSGVSHRCQRERRRAERAFVGVELHQIDDVRLLTGHIGRKLTRDLAPERVHRKSIHVSLFRNEPSSVPPGGQVAGDS